MAQFLNKGDHIFIPYCENGKNMIGNYGSARIYRSIETAIKYVGNRAHEIVEYAPIVKCGECRNFVTNGIDDNDFLDGTCLYNNGCDVNIDDFCSRGEKRSDGG